EIKILGSRVRTLAEVCQTNMEPVLVTIPPDRLDAQSVASLKRILENHAGPVPCEAQVLLDGEYWYHLALPPELSVTPGPELDRAVQAWARPG
ncbi:MAG: hypothetical protein II132_07750, partial [Desulfovibrio sp.]|nr:hypothetical protein [Desulfovibrio sp.]